MSDLGTLRVRLSHAIGLKSADSNGFSDPYIKLTLGREKRTSKIVYKTLNPRWDEDFTFSGSFSQIMNDTLTVACWDYDRLSFNDHLGDGVVPLRQLAQELEHGEKKVVQIQLKDKQATPGEVFFTISWDFNVPRQQPLSSAGYRPGVTYPTGHHQPVGGGASMHGIPPRIAQTFRYFDANNSGYLDYAELRNALAHYGMHKSTYEAADLVRKYDDNPDGKLEVGEFAELIRDLEAGVVRGGARTPGGSTHGVPARVAAVFDEFDANRSGFLDFGELRAALRRYGIDTSDAGAARILRAYDDRPDGKLDLHEFTRLVGDLEAGIGPASAYSARPSAATLTPSRAPAYAANPSPRPASAVPYRPRSPAAGYGTGSRYGRGGYGGYEQPLYGGRYGAVGVQDGLCPGGMCGGGGCGTGLGGLAYLLDVVFRTMLYSVATAAMVAPERLLGEADSLARLTGKASAAELVADTPGLVWAFLLGTLLLLLLILIDCCGVRTACAQCCGERGGPGPCTRCWRALRACLLGSGRGFSRRYYDGPSSLGGGGGGGYSRYESDVFEYTDDYRRVGRPEKGYDFV